MGEKVKIKLINIRDGSEITIEVPPQATLLDIRRELVARGIIDSTETVVIGAITKEGRKLQINPMPSQTTAHELQGLTAFGTKIGFDPQRVQGFN